MSVIGNEELVQVKLTLKMLYGSVVVSRMSVIDEITDALISECTRIVASVYMVMDEKLSGQV